MHDPKDYKHDNVTLHIDRYIAMPSPYSFVNRETAVVFGDLFPLDEY